MISEVILSVFTSCLMECNQFVHDKGCKEVLSLITQTQTLFRKESRFPGIPYWRFPPNAQVHVMVVFYLLMINTCCHTVWDCTEFSLIYHCTHYNITGLQFCCFVLFFKKSKIETQRYPMFYSVSSSTYLKLDTYIIHSTSWPATVQSDIRVCYACNSWYNFQRRASNTEEE